MNGRIITAWVLLLILGTTAWGDSTSEQNRFSTAIETISAERMLADVRRLSSPEFNGRQTGTEGDLQSGYFVAERFKSLGLTLPPIVLESTSGIVQGWAVPQSVAVVKIEDQPLLQISSRAHPKLQRPGNDFLPLMDSPSINLTAPVVFVGYGISDPTRGYDEYEGIDVKNRIVLFLRGKPEQYAGSVTHAQKVRIAQDKGAIAFLTVTGPIMSPYESRRGMGTEPSAFYGHPDGERSLPGAWISTQLADEVLSGDEQKTGGLRDIQEQLKRTLVPKSRLTTVQIRMSWETQQAPGTLYNFLATLSGSDSVLKDETIILGAHRDHFGRQAGLLFPGADDNASGTAVMLEVARVMTQSGLIPKRSILFISFSGEEQGLLGSKFYVSRPTRPMNKTLAMINVDHAGIGAGRLTVGVTGLEKTVAAQAGHTAGLADQLDLFGFFPGGDHVPFKEAGIPTVTVVSGGPHPHFHQHTDTADTVQPEILLSTARYVLALVWQLANSP